MLKNYKSIRVPLFLLVFLAAVSLLGLAGYATWVIRSTGLNARIDLASNVARATMTIAQNYYDRAQKGEFDDATAQAMAKTMMRTIRYGDNDYLFAYDVNGINVVHGVRPEREGKNFMSTRDENGVPYIEQMIKIGLEGGGTVFYAFPKPGETVSLPKASSVVYFKPWGWMIGTGVYIDAVEAAFWQNITKFATLFAVMLIILTVSAYYLSKSIVNPIRQLAMVTTHIGSGDYALSVPAIERLDEIGSLAKSIQSLKEEAQSADRMRGEQTQMRQCADEERKRGLLSLADQFERSVMSVVGTISSGVNDTNSAAKIMADAATKVKNEASEIATAAGKVDENIQTISAATEQLSSSIGAIATKVHKSAAVTQDVIDKTHETDVMVHELSSAVERISGVVNLINDIASQTNLLAMNATIEAARAGEAGKGFAVVANEVKGLANQTSSATDEIIGQIEAVKKATSRSVEALQEVTMVIASVREISDSIAIDVEQQTSATLEISGTIHKAASGTKMVADFIVEMADQTTKVDHEAKSVAETSSLLQGQTTVLNHEVGNFLKSIRG